VPLTYGHSTGGADAGAAAYFQIPGKSTGGAFTGLDAVTRG
jgi:hypothetical protein